MLKEKQWLERLQHGDRSAFELFYRQYRDHILSHLLFLLKSEDLAKDVAQDTFLTVWEKHYSVDPQKPFKSLLYTIATNKAYDLFRRASTNRRIYQQLKPLFKDTSNQVEEYILQKEHAAQLHLFLERLPEQQRKIFILVKLEGYNYREVADMLHITPHTVNTHLKRAYIFLRREIVNNPDLLTIFLSLYLQPLGQSTFIN
ncbi:MAG: RNA polymerase sigma-70 factor [Sphingobacterium sp.]|jgi:RNA polymerase sigma-70 factor (ECF subfamily)|nr:RNA polymerase sigma-70 factor [Sphingobacterium sp.]